MDFFSNVVGGFETAFSPENLLFCALGVLLGTLIGTLPGLGSATGVAIMLPVTLTLDPTGGLIMLAGIYYGSQYGASTSSILIATPGDSSSVVTMFDGYPMAKAGRAGQALAAAAIASFIAGTLSAAALMAAAPAFGAIALRFGAPESFALMVLGILSVAGFTSGNVFKGLAMGALGLVIGTIGIDTQSGVARMTFGAVSLFGGVGFIEIVIGLFAVAEVMRQVGRGGTKPIRTRLRDMILSKDDLRQIVGPSLRGGFLGFVLGVLPGAGATLASFFAYEAERRVSKTPEEFGTGSMRGLVAPEAANNAAVNGSFVPTLTLGIPGSGTTAVLLGAFLMFGIQPGPTLMVEQADLAWGLMASFWIGNILLLVLNLPMAPLFASLLRFPYRYLYPLILLLCLIGAFAIENRIWGVYLALLFGGIGYFMNRHGYPPAPLVLAVVLGPLMERQLSRSMSISYGDPMIFLRRPISAVLLVVAVLFVIGPVITRLVKRRVADQSADRAEETADDSGRP